MALIVQLMQLSLTSVSTLARFGEVFLCITAGLIVYFVGLYVLRVPEMHQLQGLFASRVLVSRSRDNSNEQDF